MSDALLQQMQRDAERLANPPRQAPAPAPVIVVEDRAPVVWHHQVERDAAGVIVSVTSRPEIPAASASTIARAIHSPYSRRVL